MTNSNKKGTSIGTILTIGLLGAAIGILFVPYRKNEMRDKAISESQHFIDFLIEKFKSIADEVISLTEKTINSNKSKVDYLKDEAKDQLEQAKRY